MQPGCQPAPEPPHEGGAPREEGRRKGRRRYQVLGEGKTAEAKSGDLKGARESYEKALAMAPEDQKKRISGEIGKLK